MQNLLLKLQKSIDFCKKTCRIIAIQAKRGLFYYLINNRLAVEKDGVLGTRHNVKNNKLY